MKGNAGDRVPSELRTCKATVVPGAIRFPVFFPIKDVVGFWGSGRSTVLVKRERTYFEPAYRSMSATNCLQLKKSAEAPKPQCSTLNILENSLQSTIPLDIQ